MPSPDQISLVQRLFVQNTMALRGFLLALMPDFSRVDDVVQETFLTVTAKADDFLDGTNFRSWVFSIARFKVLEALRKPGATVLSLDAEVIESLCATEIEDWHADEQLLALGRCLDELTPQARRAVELRYEQAHRPAEIAQRMGWTVNSVNVALARARAALRDCVERQFNHEVT
jgi:RNA polymerase sigma-70 factor, ECF subfamily